MAGVHNKGPAAPTDIGVQTDATQPPTKPTAANPPLAKPSAKDAIEYAPRATLDAVDSKRPTLTQDTPLDAAASEIHKSLSHWRTSASRETSARSAFERYVRGGDAAHPYPTSTQKQRFDALTKTLERSPYDITYGRIVSELDDPAERQQFVHATIALASPQQQVDAVKHASQFWLWRLLELVGFVFASDKEVVSEVVQLLSTDKRALTEFYAAATDAKVPMPHTLFGATEGNPALQKKLAQAMAMWLPEADQRQISALLDQPMVGFERVALESALLDQRNVARFEENGVPVYASQLEHASADTVGATARAVLAKGEASSLALDKQTALEAAATLADPTAPADDRRQALDALQQWTRDAKDNDDALRDGWKQSTDSLDGAILGYDKMVLGARKLKTEHAHGTDAQSKLIVADADKVISWATLQRTRVTKLRDQVTTQSNQVGGQNADSSYHLDDGMKLVDNGQALLTREKQTRADDVANQLAVRQDPTRAKALLDPSAWIALADDLKAQRAALLDYQDRAMADPEFAKWLDDSGMGAIIKGQLALLGPQLEETTQFLSAKAAMQVQLDLEANVGLRDGSRLLAEAAGRLLWIGTDSDIEKSAIGLRQRRDDVRARVFELKAHKADYEATVHQLANRTDLSAADAYRLTAARMHLQGGPGAHNKAVSLQAQIDGLQGVAAGLSASLTTAENRRKDLWADTEPYLQAYAGPSLTKAHGSNPDFISALDKMQANVPIEGLAKEGDTWVFSIVNPKSKQTFKLTLAPGSSYGQVNQFMTAYNAVVGQQFAQAYDNMYTALIKNLGYKPAELEAQGFLRLKRKTDGSFDLSTANATLMLGTPTAPALRDQVVAIGQLFTRNYGLGDLSASAALIAWANVAAGAAKPYPWDAISAAMENLHVGNQVEDPTTSVRSPGDSPYVDTGGEGIIASRNSAALIAYAAAHSWDDIAGGRGALSRDRLRDVVTDANAAPGARLFALQLLKYDHLWEAAGGHDTLPLQTLYDFESRIYRLEQNGLDGGGKPTQFPLAFISKDYWPQDMKTQYAAKQAAWAKYEALSDGKHPKEAEAAVKEWQAIGVTQGPPTMFAGKVISRWGAGAEGRVEEHARMVEDAMARGDPEALRAAVAGLTDEQRSWVMMEYAAKLGADSAKHGPRVTVSTQFGSAFVHASDQGLALYYLQGTSQQTHATNLRKALARKDSLLGTVENLEQDANRFDAEVGFKIQLDVKTRQRLHAAITQLRELNAQRDALIKQGKDTKEIDDQIVTVGSQAKVWRGALEMSLDTGIDAWNHFCDSVGSFSRGIGLSLIVVSATVLSAGAAAPYVSTIGASAIGTVVGTAAGVDFAVLSNAASQYASTGSVDVMGALKAGVDYAPQAFLTALPGGAGWGAAKGAAAIGMEGWALAGTLGGATAASSMVGDVSVGFYYKYVQHDEKQASHFLDPAGIAKRAVTAGIATIPGAFMKPFEGIGALVVDTSLAGASTVFVNVATGQPWNESLAESMIIGGSTGAIMREHGNIEMAEKVFGNGRHYEGKEVFVDGKVFGDPEWRIRSASEKSGAVEIENIADPTRIRRVSVANIVENNPSMLPPREPTSNAKEPARKKQKPEETKKSAPTPEHRRPEPVIKPKQTPRPVDKPPQPSRKRVEDAVRAQHDKARDVAPEKRSSIEQAKQAQEKFAAREALIEREQDWIIRLQKEHANVPRERILWAIVGHPVTGERVPLAFKSLEQYHQFQADVAGAFARAGVSDAYVQQLGSASTGFRGNPNKEPAPYRPGSDLDFAIMSEQLQVQAADRELPFQKKIVSSTVVGQPGNERVNDTYTIYQNDAEGKGFYYQTEVGRELSKLADRWNVELYGRSDVDGVDFKLNVSTAPMDGAIDVVSPKPPPGQGSVVVETAIGAVDLVPRGAAKMTEKSFEVSVASPESATHLPPETITPDKHAVTLFAPEEIARMTPEQRQALERGIEVIGKPRGVKVEQRSSSRGREYVETLDWPEAVALRKRFGLQTPDLHVRLSVMDSRYSLAVTTTPMSATDVPGYHAPAEAPPAKPFNRKYRSEAADPDPAKRVRYLQPNERKSFELKLEYGKAFTDRSTPEHLEMYDSRRVSKGLDERTAVSPKDEQSVLFAMDNDGTIYVEQPGQKGNLQQSSFLAGEPAAGAGELTIKNGEIVGVGDRSRHYPQKLEHTEQVVLKLSERGVDLAKLSVTTIDWGTLPAEAFLERMQARRGGPVDEARGPTGPKTEPARADVEDALAWAGNKANGVKPQKRADLDSAKKSYEKYRARKDAIKEANSDIFAGKAQRQVIDGQVKELRAQHPSVPTERLLLAVKGDQVTGERVPLVFKDIEQFHRFKRELAEVFASEGITDAVVQQVGSATTGWRGNPDKAFGAWKPGSDSDFAVFSEQALVQARNANLPVNEKIVMHGVKTGNNGAEAPESVHTVFKNDDGGNGFYYKTTLGEKLNEFSQRWNMDLYGKPNVDGVEFKLNIGTAPFVEAITVAQPTPPPGQDRIIVATQIPVTDPVSLSPRATVGKGRVEYVEVKMQRPAAVDKLPPDTRLRNDEYHLTLFTPDEVVKMTSAQRKEVESGISIGGKPRAIEVQQRTSDRGRMYIMTVDWPEAAKVRARFGFPPGDLHVSISANDTRYALPKKTKD